jgi:hypothetical protein
MFCHWEHDPISAILTEKKHCIGQQPAYLFPSNAHVILDIREYCRLYEVAFFTPSATPTLQRGSFRLARLYQTQDPVKLLLIYLLYKQNLALNFESAEKKRKTKENNTTRLGIKINYMDLPLLSSFYIKLHAFLRSDLRRNSVTSISCVRH